MNALGLDEQHELLKVVVERLERCGIPYMVAGSVAANSYAPAQATNNIDLVVEIGVANIDKVIEVFSNDFYINAHDAIRDSIERHYPFNVISLTSAAKVDLVPLKPDPFAQTEFHRRQSITIGADKFWYVTPEDYIISKLKTYAATKSERQWHDLKNVIATQKENLDWEYIRLWAERMNLREDFEAML